MAYYTDMFNRTLETMGKWWTRDKVMHETLACADHDHSAREEAYRSRFYSLNMPSTDYPDVRPALYPITVESISYHYDVSDGEPNDEARYFYLDDDGKLYPVTLGTFERDPNFAIEDDNARIYAHTALIANGKQVGTVNHTDH